MLSILLTGIRINNWKRLYDSIKGAYSGEWEIIIVSPYDYPLSDNNITYIKDYGSPTRCQQIALSHAKGDYVTWVVDDGFMCPKVLDKAMSQMTPDKIFCLKYTEGNSNLVNMQKDEFYCLRYHLQALRPYVTHDFKLLNFGLMSTSKLKEYGGWDCKFESLALSELDLAIRLQFNGEKIEVFKDIALICTWLPGIQGDHAPMHWATLNDQKMYDSKYSNPECWENLKIPLDNWKDSPKQWLRRFPQHELPNM